MIRLTLLFIESIKGALNLGTPEGVEGFNLLQTGYTETGYKSEFAPEKKAVLNAKLMVETIMGAIAEAYGKDC